jgi:hypothetical protein
MSDDNAFYPPIMTDESLPKGTIWFIPTREDGESRTDWKKRWVKVVDLESPRLDPPAEGGEAMTKRKPRKVHRVVLGHGTLGFDGVCLMLEPDRLRVHCDRLVLLTEKSPLGTLIWEPDPPKEKKR